jgi:subtilisin family serine protease
MSQWPKPRKFSCPPRLSLANDQETKTISNKRTTMGCSCCSTGGSVVKTLRLALHASPIYISNLSFLLSGIVIGVIDSGISPSHNSLDDKDMPPPPSMRWKGACTCTDITCNNKIIGARSLIDDSIKDDTGHGTHVASTTVSNFIVGIALGCTSLCTRPASPIGAKIWI